MKIAEILQRMSVAEEENAVLLFREGMFWRAYERGAIALCEYVHPFKVSTRYCKAVSQWICSVGFPDSSLERWTEGRKPERLDAACLSLTLSDEEWSHVDASFGEWKEQHVSAAMSAGSFPACDEGSGRQTFTTIGAQAGDAANAVMRLRAFPLERSTPMDCMNFIADLKRMLQEGQPAR